MVANKRGVLGVSGHEPQVKKKPLRKKRRDNSEDSAALKQNLLDTQKRFKANELKGELTKKQLKEMRALAKKTE